MNASIGGILSFGYCLGLASLPAQEVPAQQKEPATENVAAPFVIPADVRIVGEIANGKPPGPVEVRPRLVFQPDDVRASRSRLLGKRVVTFQKVSPIELPPLPDATPAQEAASDPELNGQVDESKQKRQVVFLGSSTYVSRLSQDKPRSYVRIWPNRPGAEPIGIWVNANFLWLTGFAEVEAGDTIYSLLMAISSMEVDSPAEVSEKIRRQQALPDLPEFDDTEASFVVMEGSPQEEDLAPIRALVALYNRDRERLRLAYQGRMEAAAERAQELRENPPARKNLVIRYWRLDQAGQAGATPKAADIR